MKRALGRTFESNPVDYPTLKDRACALLRAAAPRGLRREELVLALKDAGQCSERNASRAVRYLQDERRIWRETSHGPYRVVER